MRKLLVLVMLVAVSATMAQDKKAMKYAKTIKAKDLEERLTILASDEYEGRETGKKGQKMAAKYIADRFKEFGLEAPVNGTYFQKFNLSESSVGQLYMRKGDDRMEGFEDFLIYPMTETMGEEYVMAVVADENSDPSVYKGKLAVVIIDQTRGMTARMEKLVENGALGMIGVLSKDSEFNSINSRMGNWLKRPSLRLPSEEADDTPIMVITKASLAEWMFDAKMADMKPGMEATFILNSDMLKKPVGTENVLGYLKGTEKPDELVVITSHYDHVGIIDGQIHNGADDDGSGTTSVLEIAQAFSAAAAAGNGPKRSILFMTVTGEEKGLLGSEYYTENPIFPLENTVTNLNIDMVGRVDDAHKDKQDYVYLIGSDKLSTALHELSEEMNKNYTKLELDYTYNDENDPNRFYYRSDHYNFAKNNIPIIFYFNGTHPDYHQPSDTVEKINFPVMEKRARLVFHTAWEVANRKERITVDK